MDQTGKDVCSLECKAKQLHMEGLPSTTPAERTNRCTKVSLWGGREDTLSPEQVSQWRREVTLLVGCVCR